MMTGRRDPVASLLLVRRAVGTRERDVAAPLRGVPLDAVEVADLVRHRRVLVLSDLTLPSSAPPVAAAAFRLHRPPGTAQLAGLGVAAHLRSTGLARRLLTSALTLLRAESFEQVQACAANPAIASALFISVPTVKTHVSHILAKLGLESRVQLASWVAGHDLDPPRPARS